VATLHVDTGKVVAFNLIIHVYSDNKRTFNFRTEPYRQSKLYANCQWS